jgi:ribosomal-protein-alanine N-acetyltransferase
MAEPRAIFSPMTLADVEAVGVLEPLCFPAPWPESTYRHELRQNRLGHYWVIRRKEPALRSDLPRILAYGGYWLMGGEMHIVTLATHPAWRRRSLGEWLLLEMLAKARSQGASEATLEVRMSNLVAQQLYQKLGFVETGRRKRYYRDNGEDALIYTLAPLDDEQVWRSLEQRLNELRSTIPPLERPPR